MGKTLQNIRDKVRNLTSRKSEVQLSTSQIDFQINSYYQTEFPQQMRLLDLRQTYIFQTIPNVATYNFPPDQFQSVEPPCFVAGYTVYFTMNKAQFNALWPQLQVNEVDDQGNGTPTNYSFTTQQRPITQGTLIVSAPTSFNTAAQLVDAFGSLYTVADANANITTDPRGTVDYQNGQITITDSGFGTSIPLGNPITCQYIKYLASRPNLIYYYSNQISLFPIPDQVYEVSLTVYKIPTQLLDETDVPKFAIQPALNQPDQDISEWWEALAYGAAMKIYENNMDLDGMEAMEKLLERKLNLIRRRTWYQMASQRTSTIYAQPTVEAYPGWMYPGLFPGN